MSISYRKILAFAPALCMLLCGCHDDDVTASGEGGGGGTALHTYVYDVHVPNADGTRTVYIDSVSGNLTSTSPLPAWCKVEQTGTYNGRPVISLSYTGSKPEEIRKGTNVTLYFSDRNAAVLSLYQAYLYVASDNAGEGNEAFLTDWENCQSVQILSGVQGVLPVSKEVPTPWATAGSISSIPSAIAYDVKKADGWEMAFSLLNTRPYESANYFGLYNRNLGILRVFFYVENASGTGSHNCFEVIMGSEEQSDDHHPYYNALQYGIPLSHKEIEPDCGNITITNVPNPSKPGTFTLYCTPHSNSTSTTLKVGWTAFDIDMSAYHPDGGMTQGVSNNGLSINCYAWKNDAVSLTGSIEATIAGEYDEPYSTTTTANGIGTVVNVLKKSGGLFSALQTVAKKVDGYLKDAKEDDGKAADKKGDEKSDSAGGTKAATKDMSVPPLLRRNTRSLAAAVTCVQTAINFGTMIYDKFFDESTTEYTRGKIDMSLTGTLSLHGSITSAAATNIPSVQIGKSTMLQASKNMGKGVWALTDDPVVYIVGDHCLTTTDWDINLVREQNHTYNAGADAADYGLRMIAFLDPTSLGVSINKDIFPDVKEVHLSAYCGIYPKKAPGHTATFRRALSLPIPEAVDIADASRLPVGEETSVTDGTMAMTAHYAETDAFASSLYDENRGSATMVEVKDNGRAYAYYGYCDNAASESAFMPDPQIFFPVSQDNVRLYDDYVPDFVVCVTLSFRSGNRDYLFSRRFVPAVRVIKGSEVVDARQRLTSFAQRCTNSLPYARMGNDAAVPVYDLEGAAQVEKSLQILNFILSDPGLGNED